MNRHTDFSRRSFLQTVSGTLPTLTLMNQRSSATNNAATALPDQSSAAKFTPVDLTSNFTASSSDFGPREKARGLSSQSAKDALIRMPGGEQTFRGIPFLLGPRDVAKKSWIALNLRESSWATRNCEISLRRKSGFICLALFCDWDGNEDPLPHEDVIERVGQHLADVVLIYEDDTETRLPLRRRFEVNSPSVSWGHLSFAAVPNRQDETRQLNDSLDNGFLWGDLQIGIWDSSYPSSPDLKSRETLWLCALANPSPARHPALTTMRRRKSFINMWL
jgi:hypothetical protein